MAFQYLFAFIFYIDSSIRSLSNFLMIVRLFASVVIDSIIYLTGA